MSTHEVICTAMAQFIDEVDGAEIISAVAVARAAFTKLGGELIDGDPLQYAAFEHFKVIARKVVVGRFDPVSNADEAAQEQGELFAVSLQHRYPVPAERDASGKHGERQYKLRTAMTAEEVQWNVRRMRRARDSLDLHANSLEAWFIHNSQQGHAVHEVQA